MNLKPSCPVRIPDCLNANEIIDKFSKKKLRKDAKENLKNSIYYIMEAIISQLETREGVDRIYDEGYICLNSDILMSICGKRYIDALNVLVAGGVIERSNSYSSGNYSKGVCFINEYATQEYRFVEISEGSIKSKILAHRKEASDKNQLELDKITYLTKWYNSKLGVEKEAVHNFIEFYSSGMLDYHRRSKKASKDIIGRINARYNTSIRSVERISHQDFRLMRTGMDRRLHSAISSMKKEIRSFLRYDNEPLVGTDLRSSQPYLLNMLLKPEFYEKNEKTINIHNLYPELGNIIDTNRIQSILMSVTYEYSFQDISWGEEDFYSKIIELEQSLFKGSKLHFTTREEVKKQMMIILYDKKHKSKSFERFKMMFPKEAAIVLFFHEISTNDNFLPILMQRLESALILDVISKEISIRIPDAPIFTVHDSIMTTKKYQQQVGEIIHEILLERVGFPPGLKLENEQSEDRLRGVDIVAQDDLKEIYGKKSKKEYRVLSRGPLMYRIPELYDRKIISSRYVNLMDDYD